MSTVSIDIPQNKLVSFCKRHHIRKLSLFGSAIREDFGPDSDIDILVEFEEGKAPGLFGLASMELELSEFFGGKKVDLNTPNFLSPYFREEVLTEAEVQYVQA